MNFVLTFPNIHAHKRNIILFCLLFCYVFAFYIGPFSVSLLIAIPLYALALINIEYRQNLKQTISSKYIIRILKLWIIIVILGFLYPIIFLTFDYSFVKVILTQALHFIAAFPVLAYLKYADYTYNDVEKQFVNIFVIQTFIQVIVQLSPALTDIVRMFNRFDANAVIGVGSSVRGVALSAATTYHLTLAYGIGFVIYVRHYLLKSISPQNIFIGLAIFVGIFYAGRSGFLGVAIGFLFMFISKIKQNLFKGVRLLLTFVASIIVVIAISLYLVSILAPDFYSILEEDLLPYAFEAFYNYDKGGQLETASTNQLMQMWSRDFNPAELIWGSGYFCNPDGSFYMHVDPGALRFLLFFGVIGYIMMTIYQYSIIPFMQFKGVYCMFYFAIFLFIFIIDFKGMALGGNKFMVFIPLLLVYSLKNLKTSN